MVRESTERRREHRDSATMIRGGIGVRKRLEEAAARTTYRINGVQTGSVVARAHDRYFGDFAKGYDLGVLVRKTAQTVFIHWLGDEEVTYYSQGDARYEVDRGRWKFLGIPRKDPLNPDDPLVDALTELRRNAMMGARQIAATPPTEESKTEEEPEMAEKMSHAAAERAAAKKALEAGDLKDRDTYTAKQVATRLGTDAKTMRKFFRSTHSTVEPVGQGGRYEFAAEDLPKIKREFNAWHDRSSKRPAATKSPGRSKNDPHADVPIAAVEEDDEDFNIPEDLNEGPLPAEYDDEEPTAEELEELEDLDLDLDDLDAEED